VALKPASSLEVWCAIGCAIVASQAVVRARTESGILFGLGAAPHGEINIEKGRTVQGHFGDHDDRGQRSLRPGNAGHTR
jgi:hypothetical protein